MAVAQKVFFVRVAHSARTKKFGELGHKRGVRKVVSEEVLADL